METARQLTVHDGEPPPGTVDVIYNHLKDVAEKQFDDQKNLDGKMVQIFAVASVVMGLTGLSGGTTVKNVAVAVFLSLALTAYVAVAFFTGFEYRIKNFEALRFGDSLWREEYDQSPDQVKIAVIDRVSHAYKANNGILTDKANLLTWGMIAVAAEVVLVVVAVIIRLAGGGG